MIQRYELTGSQALGLCMERDENGDFVLFDDHNAQLAACAAGPWRFDVENAPKDGSMIWASWHKPSNPEAVFVTSLHWWENYKTWRGHGFDVREEWIINFTIPNPPQVTT